MSRTTATDDRTPSGSRRHLILQSLLPVAAGIVVAVLIGADGGIPSALVMCAAIYLFAAAVGRPASAWWGFAGALPLILLGAAFDDEWLSLIALGVAQLGILGFGQWRGRWGDRRNLLQVAGAAGFALVAIAAAAGAATPAALLIIGGMLAHAAWDVAHHRTGTVVARSYSGFCAGLDAALAVAVTIALVTNV